MMVSNIPFERGCGFIFAAFSFNGDNLSAVLQNKVYLVIFVEKYRGSTWN